MPSSSKAQHRMMAAVCSGSMKPPKGMSKATACEYMHADKGKMSKLPNKSHKKR